ncbi:MAG: archaeal proteasome endopeptidase complex subunit beta [Candidatus Aenigmarchaeota archaeon]|nr:archaeal proteasome endopeptidase complex subunit beta [Candidatus Aenigmarchaeota archaeon]
MDKNVKETGTTTVGLIYKDGVVLASERRATIGYLIESKKARKIYPIDERIAITTAGSVGDVQTIVRYLKAESSIYKFNKNKKISVRALSILLANILQENKYFPYMGQFLIGGYDENGPSIFSLDPIGGVTDGDKFYSTGSGSPMAYGVLEDGYKENMGEKDAVKLAIKAVKAAMRRDIGSGESVAVAVINKNGYRELSPEDIKSFGE